MSNTEQCESTSTNDGSPCQRPASRPDGRCHTHTEVGEQSEPGRPSKLADHWDDILAGARQGMTIEGCARVAGVARETLWNWRQKHPEFAAEFRRARAHGELQHLQSVGDCGSRFILERSFNYVKTERREIDANHDVSGDISVTEFFAEDDSTDPDAHDTDTDTGTDTDTETGDHTHANHS
jgi:transposase-like protein